MRPFEVREGMEEEHAQETDLIRCHQDLDEGERFESSNVSLCVDSSLQYVSSDGELSY